MLKLGFHACRVPTPHLYQCPFPSHKYILFVCLGPYLGVLMALLLAYSQQSLLEMLLEIACSAMNITSASFVQGKCLKLLLLIWLKAMYSLIRAKLETGKNSDTCIKILCT